MFVLFIRDCNHSIRLEIKYTQKQDEPRRPSIVCACSPTKEPHRCEKHHRMHAFRNSFDYKCGIKRLAHRPLPHHRSVSTGTRPFRGGRKMPPNYVARARADAGYPGIDTFYMFCLPKLTSGDKQKPISTYLAVSSSFLASDVILALGRDTLQPHIQCIAVCWFAHLLPVRAHCVRRSITARIDEPIGG